MNSPCMGSSPHVPRAQMPGVQHRVCLIVVGRQRSYTLGTTHAASDESLWSGMPQCGKPVQVVLLSAIGLRDMTVALCT